MIAGARRANIAVMLQRGVPHGAGHLSGPQENRVDRPTDPPVMLFTIYRFTLNASRTLFATSPLSF